MRATTPKGFAARRDERDTAISTYSADAAAREEKQGAMDRSGRIDLCLGCWRRHVLFHAGDIGTCSPDRNKGTGTADEQFIIFGGEGSEKRGTAGSEDAEHDGTFAGGSERG